MNKHINKYKQSLRKTLGWVKLFWKCFFVCLPLRSTESRAPLIHHHLFMLETHHVFDSKAVQCDLWM